MIQEIMGKWVIPTTLLFAFLLLFSCQKSAKQAAPSIPAQSRSANERPTGAAAPPMSTRALPGAAIAQSKGANAPAAGAAPQSAGAAAQSASAPPANQAQPAKAASPQLTPAITLTQESPPAQGEQPRAFASASSLMALDHAKRLLPEDFKIGPLGDDRGEKPDENSAIAAAEAFLQSIVEGAVDTKLLTPDSQGIVADALTYSLQQGYKPKSYRLGAPKSQDNGEITATVRMFGADGSSEGEIYIARAGKQWLVSDVQLSLAQMAVKREPAKDKFFPSAYRWLLEGN
jgi:hypothetical protein